MPVRRIAFPRLLPVLVLAAALGAGPAGAVTSRVLVLDRAGEMPTGGEAHRNAVRHALGAIGLAYDEVAFSASAAALDPATHPVAVVNAPLDAGSVPPAVRDALEQYVDAGGTLLATQVADAGLQPLFGVTSETTTRNAFHIDFLTAADPELFARLDRPEERRIRLADPLIFDEAFDSVGVYELEPFAVPLARLGGKDGEDLGVCMARRDLGQGRAYVLGLQHFTSIMRTEANRDAEAQRVFINGFEPGGDAVRLLLLGLVDKATGGRHVRKHALPGTYDTALLVTHDWDSSDAFLPGEWGEPIALQLARLEQALGIRSTGFLTTKFLPDAQGPAYWTPQTACDAAGLAAVTFASHTVAHRTDFQSLPPGSRAATCADYDPDQPTVNDEIRCSKERIEADLPPCLGGPLPAPVDGFRAGHLQVPMSLPQELEAAGYRYTSARSAPDVLTYYPYRLMEDSLWDRETTVIEVPLAGDDVLLGPGDPLHVVSQWRDTMKAVADNGAPFVVLIHPSRGRMPTAGALAAAVTSWAAAGLAAAAAAGEINPDAVFKLQAEASFARFARERGWPVLDLGEYAERWREREAVTLTRAVFDETSGRFEVELTNGGPRDALDLTLEFGRPIRLEALVAGDPPATEVSCRRLRLERVPAGQTLSLTAGIESADADGDAVSDGCDNCAATPNADQADFDGDGIGDACELPGDVDGSGRVDGADLSLLAAGFGALDVQPQYHEGSDLDHDGTVDGQDLALLASHFGRTFP